MTPLIRLRFAKPAAADIGADALKGYADMESGKLACFVNDLYVVYTDEEVGQGLTHMFISRHDKQPLPNWRHFQKIKNELFGEGREAVELYPAEWRVVDMGNAYHLWVFPVGVSIPFGFWEGRKQLNSAAGPTK